MLNILFLMTLAASLLGLGLIALRCTMGRRISSSFFYWAWLIVLLRFTLPVGLIPTEKQAENAYVPKQDFEYRENFFQEEMLPVEMPNFETQETEQTDMKPAYAEEKQGADFKQLLSMDRLWIAIWLAGAVFSVVWHSVGYLLFSLRLRSTLKSVNDFELQQYISIKQRFKPELAKSPIVSTPMLMGLKNALLVLPDREYSWDTLHNILLHEFTHHKRGDVILKWTAMIIFSFHWFNPLTRLFMKELDRVCELSCDEKLLKTMDRQHKQRYGETLLELAEFRTKKNSNLSTCLAMEKAVLKERLQQIMKYRRKSKFAEFFSVLCLLVLAGCAAVVGPDTSSAKVEKPTLTPEPYAAENVQATVVNTVDEFLAAIEPGANIVLSEGTFNLSEAENYGINPENSCYGWYEMGDGYELQILKADGLSITGAGMGKSSIVTDPRSVDVISFVGGQNIKLTGFTAGHTEAAGPCQGDVISFEGTRNAEIDLCELFGCGYMGVVTRDSRNILVKNSVIRDCSGIAVYSQSSSYVQVDNCEIYDCAKNSYLVGVHDTSNFVLSNNRIHDNDSNTMLQGHNNRDLKLLGNSFYDNKTVHTMFALADDFLIEACSFQDRPTRWYSDDVLSGDNQYTRARDSKGNVLEGKDLENMEHQHIDYSFSDEAHVEYRSEFLEISVKTVDEFLAAIAPNTRVVLEGEIFNLSTAENYGGTGSEWYSWQKCSDGYELVLSELKNFSIVGQGKDKTNIVATPRYANVLKFSNCVDLSLYGFTAGHSEQAGICTGRVLHITQSDNVYIEDCGLFGCGTIGIAAAGCRGVKLVKTEIYDCSDAAFNFYFCNDVSLENCEIYDMPSRAGVIQGESAIFYNGTVLDQGTYYLADGKLVKEKPEVQSYEPLPTPELGEFRIWFGQTPIESDCTMRMGDEPIRFFAGRNSVDVTEDAVTWAVSNPDAIEIWYDGLGYFCGVKVLKAVAGGVQLTATRGIESKTITIYCVE